MCQLNEIENEIHVITRCPFYDDIREDWFIKASRICDNFNVFDDNEKFVFVMNDNDIIKYSARACQAILYRRRFKLYNS